jgi:hypothetical protein
MDSTQSFVSAVDTIDLDIELAHAAANIKTFVVLGRLRVRRSRAQSQQQGRRRNCAFHTLSCEY